MCHAEERINGYDERCSYLGLFVGGVVLIKLLAFGRSSSLSRLVLNFLCRGSTYSGTASLALASSAAVLTDSGAAAALA